MAERGSQDAGGSGEKPEDPSRLFPALYDELRHIASGLLSGERSGHTLDPTGLVHEAYMKLAAQRTVGWPDRTAFIGVAAQAMRRILVDHARGVRTLKRGGPSHRIELTDAAAVFESRAIDLLALDEALDRLAELDEAKARLIEVRFFGGLTLDQAATVLNTPLRTAERDWAFARAWLRDQLEKGSPPGAVG
jgi:RNA polymerase sigma factor (TIGR02999 family)